MIKNYIKIAWRSIARHRFYSLVNIAGLGIGILFTFLICAYVWDQFSVNRQLRNADRQYYLMSEWKDPNQGSDFTTVAPIAQRLKQDYPNLVANYYRWDGITSVISKGDKHLREGIQLGDSTLLKMFGFELIDGDVHTALNEPFSVVITSAAAIKYFGKTNVVGETVSIQNFSGTQHDFKITGVLKKLKENSVTQINAENHNNFFIPTSATSYFGRLGLDAWTNIYTPSYIELQKGVQAKDLEKPIRQLLVQNAPAFIKDNIEIKPVELTEFFMNNQGGIVRKMIYTLSFVALFILIMAIVNFINIAINSSSSRMREIGIRKVLGGLRKQLVIQFFVESILLVILSTCLALALYPVAQPFFGELVGKQISSLVEFPSWFVAIPFIIILIVGIGAGLYPAWILSSLKSVDSLKGKLKTIKENVLLRKSLVGFQFGIAMIVLTTAIIVTQQVKYFFSQNLGYDKDYIVSSQVPRDWSPQGVRRMETVRNEFSKMPGISMVTVGYEIPNGMNGNQPSVYKLGDDSTSAVAMQSMVTDGNYSSVYRIPIKAGKYLSNEGSIDSLKVVLNEKAINALGWNDPTEAIGRQVRVPNDPRIYTVQGVVQNFHFGSMQTKIEPFIIFHIRVANAYRYLSFKLKPGNIGNSIAAIEKKWATLLPGSSFEYRFMDETLEKLYASEIQMKKAAYTATFLCLVIVLLGVLGLISLSVQKRTKEIGIRKVLGSSVPEIIGLFMKEFVLVVAIASLVACPIAYLIAKMWLNGYAYRIDVTALPFITSIGLLGVLTCILIALQTLKAGFANPVKSLRTE